MLCGLVYIKSNESLTLIAIVINQTKSSTSTPIAVANAIF